MLSAETRADIDRIWDAFWSAGVTRPVDVVDQVGLLLFARYADSMQTALERKALRTDTDVAEPLFPDGWTPTGVPATHLRWSYLKDESPDRMFDLVCQHLIPFAQSIGRRMGTYGGHLSGLRVLVDGPNRLVPILDLVDRLPLRSRNDRAAVFDHFLAKLEASGRHGMSQTPRHIVELVVALMEPTADDEICDPAVGTGGFLTTAAEHVRSMPTSDAGERPRIDDHRLRGYEIDQAMARIASMSLLMRGHGDADIALQDALAEETESDAGRYSLVMVNPPFGGTIGSAPNNELLLAAKTKRTELLFLELALGLLRKDGRAAAVVSESVLFGTSQAHRTLRRRLVEEHRLDGVIRLPSGTFRPHVGIGTAILLFGRTDERGTDHVWFYDLEADGFSLDDRRRPLLPREKLGPRPGAPLGPSEHDLNNLPDALRRWHLRHSEERGNPRMEQSFCVPRAEIAAKDYDLSLPEYRTTLAEVAIKNGVRLGDLLDQNVERVPADGHLIIGGRHLTGGTISLDSATPEGDPGGIRPLQAGDVVGRILGDPIWTVVTDVHLRSPLAADRDLHVLRPTGITPMALHALLSSELVTEQVDARRRGDSARGLILFASLCEVMVPSIPHDGQHAIALPDARGLRSAMNRFVDDLEGESGRAFTGRTWTEAALTLADASARARTAADVVERFRSPQTVAQLTYPHPLAHALRSLEVARSVGDARHENEEILHAFEIALILTGAVAGARMVMDTGRVPTKWRKGLTNGVSLGNWHTLARLGAEHAAQQNDELDGLAAALSEGADLDALFADFLVWRNDRAHGGGPRSDSQYERANADLRPRFDRLIDALRPLGRMRLWIVDDLDAMEAKDAFELRTRTMHGDHPDFIPRREYRDQAIRKGTLMVTSRSRRTEFSLKPLLIYVVCEGCLAHRFFYADKLSGGTVTYRSLTCQHKRAEAEDAAHDALRPGSAS
jgi:type I restriction enzyme M protein